MLSGANALCCAMITCRYPLRCAPEAAPAVTSASGVHEPAAIQNSSGDPWGVRSTTLGHALIVITGGLIALCLIYICRNLVLGMRDAQPKEASDVGCENGSTATDNPVAGSTAPAVPNEATPAVAATRGGQAAQGENALSVLDILQPILLMVCNGDGSDKHKRWVWVTVDSGACMVCWGKNPGAANKGPFKITHITSGDDFFGANVLSFATSGEQLLVRFASASEADQWRCKCLEQMTLCVEL